MAERLPALEKAARAMALAMEFGFLLDNDRKLLSIGYLVSEGTLDPSCYDLLASEARLASFMAIAKGDIPARHWFRLGRAVTPIAHGAALISWSGSMFEYLMPSLVMRAPAEKPHRADEPADRAPPDRVRGNARRPVGHIRIRLQRSRPRIDISIFELRNSRSRSEARTRGERRHRSLCDRARSMVDPHAAARNFCRLAAIGARGRYGFYEALDYTPVRVPEGKPSRSCGPSWRTIRA